MHINEAHHIYYVDRVYPQSSLFLVFIKSDQWTWFHSVVVSASVLHVLGSHPNWSHGPWSTAMPP